MSSLLLSPTFLFRFAAPCRRFDGRWSNRGITLDPQYAIPCFGELENRPRFADLRIGWSPAGLAVTVEVAGKKQTPWCRASKIEDSDALQLWIDTRDTHTIHRAGRFCHRFALMPYGSGYALDEPTAAHLAINRAKESPRPAPDDSLHLRTEKRIDGYRVEAFLDAEALTGFDPVEHPRLGFSYAVIDRELGWQTFSISNEFPVTDDPSLWGTLELVS